MDLDIVSNILRYKYSSTVIPDLPTSIIVSFFRIFFESIFLKDPEKRLNADQSYNALLSITKNIK